VIGYYTPISRPFGSTYGRWTVKWWNWVVSIPLQINPVIDKNGANAMIKQRGPAWFLGGCFAGESLARRKCIIPEDKSILFPVLNYETNMHENPEIMSRSQLLHDVSQDIDNVLYAIASVDGLKVPVFRIKSDPEIFSLRVPEENCLGIQSGVVEASADGYWVFLRPLAKGKHQIKFHGMCPGNILLGAHYDLIVEGQGMVTKINSC
jgi:hypothetical protein